MAVEFKNAEGKEISKRINSYNIDPRFVVVVPELNGRHELPEVETLIADMLSKPDGCSIKGQTTPVLIRKDGSRPVLVAGHRRLRAVLEINKRKLLPEPLPLLCSYRQLTEAEALSVAVTENRERKGINPLDEAYCIKQFVRMGKDHEWIALRGGFFPELALRAANNGDDPEFAKELKKAVLWVKRREKLLGLTDEGQQALSTGKITPTAAEHLAELESEKQRSILKEGKVTGPKIAKASGKVERLKARDIRAELDTVLSEYGAVKGVPKELLDMLQSLRDRI